MKDRTVGISCTPTGVIVAVFLLLIASPPSAHAQFRDLLEKLGLVEESEPGLVGAWVCRTPSGFVVSIFQPGGTYKSNLGPGRYGVQNGTISIDGFAASFQGDLLQMRLRDGTLLSFQRVKADLKALSGKFCARASSSIMGAFSSTYTEVAFDGEGGYELGIEGSSSFQRFGGGAYGGRSVGVYLIDGDAIYLFGPDMGVETYQATDHSFFGGKIKRFEGMGKSFEGC